MWWGKNPMSYDWQGTLREARFSREWFDAIDMRFLHGTRLFASDYEPFDRIIPFPRLAGARVLEIGCGMGLHTELMSKAGAKVTAIDITDTAIEATRIRLDLKGLQAKVLQVDAEELPFDEASFDFVWSWGVIHHSAHTARIVRQIARVLTHEGECRVMVYNRESMAARLIFIKDYLLRGQCLKHSFEETLYQQSDGFSARFFVREHFEDLFRAFFAEVCSCVFGQESDAIPLPRRARAWTLNLVPESYLRAAQARRGLFIFVTAGKRI